MPELRKCLYHGNKYLFHRWFQEGYLNRYPNDETVEGGIDIGAILENPYSGKVKQVFDIEHIQFQFKRRKINNECSTTC